MLECLARAVCRMPGRDARLAFLGRYEDVHGRAARGALADRVRAVWPG